MIARVWVWFLNKSRAQQGLRICYPESIPTKRITEDKNGFADFCNSKDFLQLEYPGNIEKYMTFSVTYIEIQI